MYGIVVGFFVFSGLFLSAGSLLVLAFYFRRKKVRIATLILAATGLVPLTVFYLSEQGKSDQEVARWTGNYTLVGCRDGSLKEEWKDVRLRLLQGGLYELYFPNWENGLHKGTWELIVSEDWIYAELELPQFKIQLLKEPDGCVSDMLPSSAGCDQGKFVQNV